MDVRDPSVPRKKRKTQAYLEPQHSLVTGKSNFLWTCFLIKSAPCREKFSWATGVDPIHFQPGLWMGMTLLVALQEFVEKD